MHSTFLTPDSNLQAAPCEVGFVAMAINGSFTEQTDKQEKVAEKAEAAAAEAKRPHKPSLTRDRVYSLC